LFFAPALLLGLGLGIWLKSWRVAAALLIAPVAVGAGIGAYLMRSRARQR
jgi:hypothetical protein